MLFGRRVAIGWSPNTSPLGNKFYRLGVWEQRFDEEDVALTVVLEAPLIREKGGRCHLSCKLRKLLIPIANSHHG